MLKTTLTSILLCTSLSAFSTVKEIKAEYKIVHDAIEKALYTKKIKITKDHVVPEVSKEIYLNDKGTVKKLVLDYRGESTHIKEYFYTNSGKLFFTYEYANDEHSGKVEVRRYYNDDMKLIDEKITEGKKGIASAYPDVIENAFKYFQEKL